MSDKKAERKWTPEQKEAIYNRNGTLIVSAAAGSGKTAVLVERVIKRITDAENPCDADKLLIVTFTRAATAEMRSRLEAAIRSELKKDPENGHLQKQQMLLPLANIYTIDAFCTTLVRENFDVLQIPPDFTMLDESELLILENQAVATVVEGLYEEDSEAFKQLVELTSQGSDDSSVEENIIKLYKYSRAYPSPDKWLSDAVLEYTEATSLKSSVFGKVIKDNAIEFLSFHADKLEFALKSLLEIPELSDCQAVLTLKNELKLNQKTREHIENFEFDKALSLTDSFVYDRWSVSKGFSKDPAVLLAKDIRSAHKDELTKNHGLRKYLCSTEEEFAEDIAFIAPIAEKLISAVSLFDKELMRLKNEKKAFDFSDIELMALKLLVENPAEEKDENLRRTALAEDLGLRFEEILIDEYQDTNKAQDMIFRALSKNGKNLFMVGDVKQSIYGFRQAMPEIFLEKKKTLDNAVILGKNFRSRKGVTEYINFVFSKLMSESCGGTAYSDDEKLVFGAEYYEEASSDPDLPEVELHVLDTDKASDTLEEEAKFIAKIINEKVEKGLARYNDFAILMQAPSGRGKVIEKVLSENGIPVYTDAGGNFFETSDISVIVSLLRVIDNPLQDIPLLTVLLSPIFGFTTDDISILRINQRKGSLYSTLLNYSETDIISEKCSLFLDTVSKYRRLSATLPSGELIRRIYEDTAFPAIASAMPGGRQRAANLRLLIKYADNYDKTSTYGVSGFVRFIDRLMENGIDQTPAGIISENSNVIRIMSIHKSKGLEFKYCILADTNKSFNKMDQIQNVILHPSLGVGIRGRDLNTGNTYPTLMHTAIKLETDRNQMSEILRVLYVALTRAREKLIITGAVSGKLENLIDKSVLAAAVSADFDNRNRSETVNVKGETAVHQFAVRHARTLLELILMATISHPASKCLRDLSSYNSSVLPVDFNIICKLHEAGEVSPSNDNSFENENSENSCLEEYSEKGCSEEENVIKLTEELKSRMDYKYPYEKLSEVLSKRSASKTEEIEFSSQFFATARPDFLSKSGLTPAERGTYLHKFMQYANFEVFFKILDSEPLGSEQLKAKESVKEAVEKELSRLVKENYLSESEVRAIDAEKACRFFTSDMFSRLKASDLIMREKKFAVLVPAARFDNTENGDIRNNPALRDEPVLIQGIADCVFEENGSFVVLDYKTDRETDEKLLITRHRPQLETYVEALAQILDKPISGAYIYSFSLGKDIEVI